MKFEKRLEHLEQLQAAKRYEPPVIVTRFIEPNDGEAKRLRTLRRNMKLEELKQLAIMFSLSSFQHQI